MRRVLISWDAPIYAIDSHSIQPLCHVKGLRRTSAHHLRRQNAAALVSGKPLPIPGEVDFNGYPRGAAFGRVFSSMPDLERPFSSFAGVDVRSLILFS
jgi:hypothetical protein